MPTLATPVTWQGGLSFSISKRLLSSTRIILTQSTQPDIPFSCPRPRTFKEPHIRTLSRLFLALASLVLLLLAGAYIDGLTLPDQHVATVTGTVAAPPAKVFALITDIPSIPTWRHAVKSVTILPSADGRDHWTEHLAHNQDMTFLATRTESPTRRDVLLDLATPSYGGTWTYLLAPGPTPNTTTLTITETGFIHPPLYRFLMTHVLGLTYNLNQYLSDARAAAPTL